MALPNLPVLLGWPVTQGSGVGDWRRSQMHPLMSHRACTMPASCFGWLPQARPPRCRSPSRARQGWKWHWRLSPRFGPRPLRESSAPRQSIARSGWRVQLTIHISEGVLFGRGIARADIVGTRTA